MTAIEVFGNKAPMILVLTTLPSKITHQLYNKAIAKQYNAIALTLFLINQSNREFCSNLKQSRISKSRS